MFKDRNVQLPRGSDLKRPNINKARREQRQKEAQQRNDKWKQLSPQQQLAELDQRLGKDIGAARQREKLKKLIEQR